MKRLILCLTLVVAFSVGSTSIAAADTSNFRFASFEADYYLNKDTGNRSVLKIEERLVAEFPNSDQNHGIERAIPQEYDDHPVNVGIQSVTDDNGKPLTYTTYDSNNNEVLRIGDADTYAHGRQIYRITYTLHDVTKNFDTGDELYWDTNGTDWQQAFGSVTARLHIPATLTSALDGRTVCYAGLSGKNDTTSCTITTTNTGSETLITAATTRQLAAYENLTFVTGFKANTFTAYVKPPMPLWQKIVIPIAIIVGALWYIVIPIYAFIKGFRRWRLSGRDSTGKGTIVPEYLPPKGISTLLSSVILSDRMPPKAVSAAIIDLAVRHYLKIYEIKKDEYELELVKPLQDLLPEEQRIVNMLFGTTTNVGARIKLKDKTSIYKEVSELGKTVYEKAIAEGFMADTRAAQKKISLAGGLLLGFGIVTLSPLGFLTGIALLIFGSSMPARTVQGIALKEYLLGLKEYMQMAEADRIRQLQSPTGANRIPVDASDTITLVKLYERLLPYAVLFSIEEEWAKQFAHLYSTPPDWYAGTSPTFNAVVFASAIHSFGTTSVNSFSPPSSSSSSGFSGGSSGGGGGGGGGGGW